MNNPFDYQMPSEQQVHQMHTVRLSIQGVYDIILNYVPECAERTLAIRKLQEVYMWANAAIESDGEIEIK